MTRLRYTLFSTTFGTCGVAWSVEGIVRVQLPEADIARTEARLGRLAELAPREDVPPRMADTIARLRAYFDGAPMDFRDVVVDSGAGNSPFAAIYAATQAVGWGETATYGQVAKRAGIPHGAQAVGQAMARNPVPIVIPCHRILAANGRLGGFSAPGGPATKERLLRLEGIAPGKPAGQMTFTFGDAPSA